MPNEEKEAVKLEDTSPSSDNRKGIFLVYANIELEVEALDPEGAENESVLLFRKLEDEFKANRLRINHAKVADPETGYFFKK